VSPAISTLNERGIEPLTATRTTIEKRIDPVELKSRSYSALPRRYLQRIIAFEGYDIRRSRLSGVLITAKRLELATPSASFG
jgi:uncharacterized protein YmfQ (DUF2313 family)